MLVLQRSPEYERFIPNLFLGLDDRTVITISVITFGPCYLLMISPSHCQAHVNNIFIGVLTERHK